MPINRIFISPEELIPGRTVTYDEVADVAAKLNRSEALHFLGFLNLLLPYTHAAWETLSIFLNFLVPKLPSPVEADLSKGILESIDMDSYRVEKQAARDIPLVDADAEIDPVPTTGGGSRPEGNGCIERCFRTLGTAPLGAAFPGRGRPAAGPR